jgi:hypothetical protein
MGEVAGEEVVGGFKAIKTPIMASVSIDEERKWGEGEEGEEPTVSGSEGLERVRPVGQGRGSGSARPPSGAARGGRRPPPPPWVGPARR